MARLAIGRKAGDSPFAEKRRLLERGGGHHFGAVGGATLGVELLFGGETEGRHKSGVFAEAEIAKMGRERIVWVISALIYMPWMSRAFQLP
jgi:hypothetical protein